MHSSLESRLCGAASVTSDISQLSYKFQRLREQLRSAILTGELSGRLPGERELGRRYDANAKTINKALCDLSSEGLVVRRIGRGTFVSGPTANGEVKTTKVFSCLMPDPTSTPPHRTLLLERLRATLAASGHRMVSVPASGKPRSAIKTSIGPGDEPAGNGSSHRDSQRTVDGMFCLPADPLGASIGEPSDDLVVEALRRQMPLVLIGTNGTTAKVCAVSPDFVDAGFRLTEHMLSAGCKRVLMLFGGAESRCRELIQSGGQSAAARVGHVSVEGALCSQAVLLRAASISASEKVGIVAVGAALSWVMREAAITSARQSGRMALAALCEPGDVQASASGVTSYEVDVSRIASWAAKLAMEHRPGQRPVEVVVPGILCVRDGGMNGTRPGATMREAIV